MARGAVATATATTYLVHARRRDGYEVPNEPIGGTVTFPVVVGVDRPTELPRLLAVSNVLRLFQLGRSKTDGQRDGDGG
jgi:hypothetical protein